MFPIIVCITITVKNISYFFYEILNPVENTTYNAKVGLIYVSDYGYGAIPEKWTNTLGTLYYGVDNWLYLGFGEWTITRNSDSNSVSFIYDLSGYINSMNLSSNPPRYTARPVFYLNSNVEYLSGNGSISNPIRIN